VPQFEILTKLRRRRSLIWAQGSSCENPGNHYQKAFIPWKGSPTAEPFQGSMLFNDLLPGLSLALQPWAQISERLRRNLVKISNWGSTAKPEIYHNEKTAGCSNLPSSERGSGTFRARYPSICRCFDLRFPAVPWDSPARLKLWCVCRAREFGL